MTAHAFDRDADRCRCGGVIVYFENDGHGPDGEGCEVAGYPWRASDWIESILDRRRARYSDEEIDRYRRELEIRYADALENEDADETFAAAQAQRRTR